MFPNLKFTTCFLSVLFTLFFLAGCSEEDETDNIDKDADSNLFDLLNY